MRAEDVPVLTATEPFRGVGLLPGFDPFTNELPRRVDSVLPVAHHDRVYRTAGWVTPLVLVDGRVGGTWEIGGGKKAVVEVTAWGRWRGGSARRRGPRSSEWLRSSTGPWRSSSGPRSCPPADATRR